MVANLWESAATLLTVLTPLAAVPLTVITFYLRSLREHQLTWHADLIRRLEAAEHFHADLRKRIHEMERDYTTKEEWLRESMHTRRILERLTESTVRIEATLQAVLSRPDTKVEWAESTRSDRALAAIENQTVVKKECTANTGE